MTADELLLELKDIAPPAEPPWWLLSPAEMLALGVVLALLVLIVYRRRRRRALRLAAAADAELDAIRRRHADHRDGTRLARELADWLKRVALQAFPRQSVAALCGNRWLAFLDRVGGETAFSRGPGRIFGDTQYRPQAEFDADAVIALCRGWLRAVRPRLRSRGRQRC